MAKNELRINRPLSEGERECGVEARATRFFGSRSFGENEKGQMTVELAVMLPVAIAIAVIVVNAMLFFSECASFDRLARNAIRVCAASPGYGQAASQSCAEVAAILESSFCDDNLSVSVSSASASWGHTTFTARLDFSPTLFGMGLKSSVFGVELPKLHHATSLTVNVYKPGVIL